MPTQAVAFPDEDRVRARPRGSVQSHQDVAAPATGQQLVAVRGSGSHRWAPGLSRLARSRCKEIWLRDRAKWPEDGSFDR